MRIEILDKRIKDDKSWFLGRISLWDYLSAVSVDNFEFDIQRGIVKNRYLDSILSSISNKEPIPPITITTDKYIDLGNSCIEVLNDDFNILDGLQRTYRLWLYKKISDMSEPKRDLFDNISYDLSEIISKLKESEFYIPGVISLLQIKSLLDNNNHINVSLIPTLYRSFYIYLYIWVGLDEKEIINKMLILNAGQRMVSINHQYELMFLKIFKDNKVTDKVNLIREKDKKYGKVKYGDRNLGDFIFSSVIIGIQSLIEGKPVRLSAENLEIGYNDEFISEEDVSRFFNQPFLNIYLESLYKIDSILNKYSDAYKKWFVKDTTLSGIMGAVGYYIKNIENIEYSAVIDKLLKAVNNEKCFNIDVFYSEYNKLSSTRINIGEKVRDAIFKYTLSLLNNEPIEWNKAFTLNQIEK